MIVSSRLKKIHLIIDVGVVSTAVAILIKNKSLETTQTISLLAMFYIFLSNAFRYRRNNKIIISNVLFICAISQLFMLFINII